MTLILLLIYTRLTRAVFHIEKHIAINLGCLAEKHGLRMQGSQSTAPGFMLTITACMETGSTVKQLKLFMTTIEVQRSA